MWSNLYLTLFCALLGFYFVFYINILELAFFAETYLNMWAYSSLVIHEMKTRTDYCLHKLSLLSLQLAQNCQKKGLNLPKEAYTHTQHRHTLTSVDTLKKEHIFWPWMCV